MKIVLQAQKQQVADLVAELERRGRELSGRWETVELQTTLLSGLPGRIEDLEGALEELRARGRKGDRGGRDEDGGGDSEDNGVDERMEMNLPLPATRELVEERRARLEEVEAQLKALRQGVPRMTRALEQEERELGKLQAEKDSVVREAREAVERKKEGGGADEMELQGRWLRGVEGGMRGMLEVEA